MLFISLSLYRRAFILVIRVGKNLEHGAEKDLYVQREADVIHVPYVHFDSFVPFHILAAMNLGPACDTGANLEHSFLLFVILVDGPGVIGQRRPGADEAHIPTQHIDGLRQLIDAGSPDDPSHLRNPGVMPVAVDAAAGMLRILYHGAELQHGEFLSVQAQAGLAEQSGAFGFQPDGDGRDQKDRGQDDQHQQSDQDIDQPLDVVLIQSAAPSKWRNGGERKGRSFSFHIRVTKRTVPQLHRSFVPLFLRSSLQAVAAGVINAFRDFIHGGADFHLVPDELLLGHGGHGLLIFPQAAHILPEYVVDFHDIRDLGQIAEGAGENGPGGAQAVMLHDDLFRGEHALSQPGDAAEAIGDTGLPEFIAELLHRAVRQGLKHEGHAIGKMQVIEADMHLVEAALADDFIHTFHRFLRFQQQGGFAAAAHRPEEGANLLRRFPVGQHDDIRAGGDDLVDLLLRAFVPGVNPDQHLGFGQQRLDIGDIRNLVVALNGVHVPLALFLAQGFQIHPDPVHTVFLRHQGHVRPVRDIEDGQRLNQLSDQLHEEAAVQDGDRPDLLAFRDGPQGRFAAFIMGGFAVLQDADLAHRGPHQATE